MAPAVVAIGKQQQSRADYLDKVATDSNTPADDAQQAANRDAVLKTTEAAQIDVPAPTDAISGTIEVAKAVFDWAKDKVSNAVDAGVRTAKEWFGVGSKPSTGAPTGGARQRNVEGFTSPCQQAGEFFAHCESVNWTDSDCRDFQNRVRRCDPTISYTVDGGPCPEEGQREALAGPPPSPTCSAVSHPIPGTDPCNPEQPKGPIERSSPASNPCDGVNPYGYTTEEGCPATVDLATPPIVRGPQPDPTGPGVGPGPVRQTTLPLSGPAGWSPAGVAVG